VILFPLIGEAKFLRCTSTPILRVTCIFFTIKPTVIPRTDLTPILAFPSEHAKQFRQFLLGNLLRRTESS